MQTPPAVSAGSYFNASGAEASSADPASSPAQTATADFDQHMQQSFAGHPARAMATAGTKTSATPAAVVALDISIDATGMPALGLTAEGQLASCGLAWTRAPLRFSTDGPAPEGEGGESQLAGKAEGEAETTTDSEQLAATELSVLATLAATSQPAPVMEQLPKPTGGSTGGSAGGTTEAMLEADDGGEVPVDSRVLNGDASPAEERPAVTARPNAEPPSARAPGSSRTQAPSTRGSEVRLPDAAPPADASRVEQSTIQKTPTEGAAAPIRPAMVNQPEAKHANEAAAESPKPAAQRGTEERIARGVEVSQLRSVSDENIADRPALLRQANALTFHGTVAAKIERSMDKRLEQNQFAGSPEQKLPPAGKSAPTTEVRPLIERAIETVREAVLERPERGLKALAEGLAVPGAGGQTATSAPATGSLEGSSGSNTANAVRTAEQVLQNLTREVAQFKRFNSESMAVVLKPDANTEIFLHLVTTNGRVDIQARFERGDFAALNGQWAQLQQALSQQGVRLSSLQEGFNQPSAQQQNSGSSEWGHSQMNQGQRRQPGREAEEGAPPRFFENLLRAGSKPEAAKSTGRTRGAFHHASAALEAWA